MFEFSYINIFVCHSAMFYFTYDGYENAISPEPDL